MKNIIYDLLLQKGAIMEGHFVLTSGLHSNRYIEKFRVLEDPKALEIICKEMASKFKEIDLVVSAAIGGILLSSGVAKEFGVKGIFCGPYYEKRQKCDQHPIFDDLGIHFDAFWEVPGPLWGRIFGEFV